MVKLHCGEPMPRGDGLQERAFRPGSPPRFKRIPPSCTHPLPRGIVIVRSSQAANQHQSASIPPGESGLRHRQEPLPERRQRWLAIAVAGVLHVLFVLVLWHQMRPPVIGAVVHVQLDDVLRVRFISHAPPTAAPPPAIPAPVSPRTPVRPSEPPAKNAMTLRTPTPVPVHTPSPLYDKHGQPLLPAATASVSTPDYVQRMPQGDTQIMQHDSPVTYQATRFDKDWSSGGNAIDGALQKLVDKTTVKKTVRLPGGIRLHCSLFIFAGGCVGDPPSPPSAKDGDARLSMAPAKPLDGDAHAPIRKPTIEACIAMYRAGKPLEWGCPSDTPIRSVDEEMRERAEGAAKHP